MAYIGLITTNNKVFDGQRPHIFHNVGYVCNIDKYYTQENKMMDAIEQKNQSRILMGKDRNVVAQDQVTNYQKIMALVYVVLIHMCLAIEQVHLLVTFMTRWDESGDSKNQKI